MSLEKRPTLRAYLELVRPPALFTSAADSLTGCVWASSLIGGASYPASGLSFTGLAFSCLLISVCVYAAGMCTNDLFDHEEDLRDRPQRPLPSGRISRVAAWRFALLLQLLALASSALIPHLLSLELRAGHPWLWFEVTLFTIGATYLYNGPLKNTLIAPVIMGLCRFGNFWIGGITVYAMSNATPDLHTGIAFSAGTALYVTLLTVLSRFEVSGGRDGRIAAGLLCLSSLTPLLWWLNGWMSLGACAALLLAVWLSSKMWTVLSGRDTGPSQIQRSMGSGIRGVALLNVVLCLGLGGMSGYLTACLLLLLAWSAGRIGRWFYAT